MRTSPAISVCIHLRRPPGQHHRLGGLNDRNVFSHSSEGWTSKIKVSVCRAFLLRPLSLAGRGLSSSDIFTRPFLCVNLCGHPLFLEGQQSDGVGPTLVSSVNLSHLFRDPLSKQNHIQRYCGLGLQCMNLGSTTQPFTRRARSMAGVTTTLVVGFASLQPGSGASSTYPTFKNTPEGQLGSLVLSHFLSMSSVPGSNPYTNVIPPWKGGTHSWADVNFQFKYY